MNKFAKLMCLVAVLAVVGTSCKKKEEAVTCTASFAELQYEEGDAKSYYVGTRLQWETTDRVVIFNTDNTDNVFEGVYRPTGNGNNVSLTPVGGGLEQTNSLGAFYAFYPANVVDGGYQAGSATPDGEHVTARFLLPKEQQYRTVNGQPVIPTNGLACAAKDASASKLSNAHFNILPICGVLDFKFYTPVAGKKVDYITVEDKHFNTTGYVDLYIDMIDSEDLTRWINNFSLEQSYLTQLAQYKEEIGYYIPELAENPDLGNMVTLQCGGVNLSTNKNNPTHFYVAMRPAACYSGMRVKIYFTDGTYANAINSTYNNMIKPNHVKAIPTVAVTPIN